MPSILPDTSPGAHRDLPCRRLIQPPAQELQRKKFPFIFLGCALQSNNSIKLSRTPAFSPHLLMRGKSKPPGPCQTVLCGQGMHQISPTSTERSRDKEVIPSQPFS